MGSDEYNQSQFIDALFDYFYLIDRSYPEKGALKLVGDKYRLTGKQRTILYRGVSSDTKNNLRQNRLTQNLEHQELVIDGYNVLFTLMNYKLGRMVFISTDGFCRDAGSLFGKIRKQENFIVAMRQAIAFLLQLRPAFITVVFDSPVSFSKGHAYQARTLLDEFNIDGEVKVVRYADTELIDANSGILCTSDSGIMDQTNLPLADLSRLVIEHFYSPAFLNLQLMLERI